MCFPAHPALGKEPFSKNIWTNTPIRFFLFRQRTRNPGKGKPRPALLFLSREEFDLLVENGGLLEYAQFAGNFYGTPREAVEQNLEKGIDVVLEIEVQGALQVKEKCPDALLVFVMPPSFEELCRRLAGRGTEDAAAVGCRLSNAAREMEAAKHYDYIVVNQTVEDAVDQLEQIVCAAKHTAKYLREFIDEVEYDAETCCK